MIKIEIEGKYYQAKTTDHDVLLQDAIAITKVKLPKQLRLLYESLFEEEKKKPLFSTNFLEVIFPKYAKKIINILTDIPENVLDNISPNDRIRLYTELLEEQVFSVLFEGCKHDVQNISDFTHKGVTYVLPESTEIMGIERPMYKECFITWSEVDDLMKASRNMVSGNMEAAKHVISIMARPKGEKYNEAVSLERAESFLTLPMFVVWEVFFCTVKQLNIFSIITASRGENKRKSKPTPRVFQI